MAVIDEYLKQNPYQPQKQQAQAKKSKGNLFTHLLPTAGGTAGAVSGAALGTAIAPGIGTLLGALIGGAAAGGASKVGENMLEHNKNITQGVAGQAIEQGVLGAGPIRLAKAATFGVKAGVGAAGAGQGLEAALTAASAKANKPVFGGIAKDLVTQGQAAQGRVAGVSAGQKIAGKELTPQDTQKMLSVLKNEQIKTGNANNTFRDLQAKLNQYGKDISTHFTTNNTPLTKTQVNTIAKDYVANLKTSDPAILKQANVLKTDLKNNVTDTQSLWKFRKGLDSRIPDAKQGTDEATTAKITALKALRRHVTDQLGNVPGAKNYHDLAEIKPFISAEARRLNNPGGGIVGRIAASGPVQKTESVLGKGLEKTGSALGGTNMGADLTHGLTPGAIARRTVPIGTVQALAGSAQDNAQPQADAQQPQTSDTSQNDLLNALMQAQDQQPQSANPYSQDNLMSDIQRDPKHASQYIDTFNSLDKIFNPAQNSKNTIKPTGQQFGLAQGGSNALNQLTQLLQKDPSLAARNQTPGQGLPLVGNLITNSAGVGDYHALADNILQSLIHLQTGATATPEEVKAARGQLPGPGDPPEVVQRKLSNLQSMFQPYLQGGQIGGDTGGSSNNDLMSALMAAGYGQ